MERISFQVAEFDAPLDLILHLISKHKLDILDIDITSLLDQYLETIEHWKKQDLDIASECLQMASRLVYMKTVSLLPKHKDESDKLRDDLSGELMEYQICKLASEMLDEQNLYSDIFIRQPMEVDIDPTYKQVHLPHILYEALVDAMGKQARRRPPTQDEFDPIVARPFVSVNTKIVTVLRTLRTNDRVIIQDIFDPDQGRSGLVATFLAILELIKVGRIYLEDDILTIRNDKKEGTD